MTGGTTDPDISTPAAGSDDVAGRAAGRVAAGILLSRILGLVRTRLIGSYLGLGVEADAYNAALKIPNVVRNLLGEGATSASFIPVYSALIGKGDARSAGALAGALLGILLAFVSAITIAGIALAPVIADLFVTDPRTAELLERLVRVLFPMTGLMVISGWCLAVQNSHRRFFISYASAALWSLAQIALLVVGGSRADSLAQLAWWLAWATLAGAVLQVAVQLPQAMSLARPLRVSLDLDSPGVRQTLRNFAPVVVALGAVNISGLIDLWIAGRLPTGAIAAISYAAMIYTLPISLFGISVAASSLPEFARSEQGSFEPLVARLRQGWMRILFYIVPSTLASIAFGDLIIGVLLQSGSFGAAETRIVWFVLAGYSIGLIGYTSVRLLASAHYAIQDYRTPLRASAASIVLSAALGFGLALPFRLYLEAAAVLAVGSALGAYLNLYLLARGLRRRVGALYSAAMWRGTWRIIGAAAAAGMIAAAPRVLLSRQPIFLVALGTLGVFGGIYLVIADRAGSPEAARLLRLLRLRRGPLA